LVAHEAGDGVSTPGEAEDEVLPACEAGKAGDGILTPGDAGDEVLPAGDEDLPAPEVDDEVL